MPTFDTLWGFQADWDRLDPVQRRAFSRAVANFVEDLRTGKGFRKGLRVKKMSGHDDVWELTWAPDGRATFEFGSGVLPGEVHVVWRRIGGHEIFKRP